MHPFQQQRYETRNQLQEKIGKEHHSMEVKEHVQNNEWAHQ